MTDPAPWDVIIIGGGASGLFCAIEAAKRGRRVLVIEHANKVGKKILMSGGGRCNFTNYHIAPECFLSANRHFCKSALSRYSQWDFIALVAQYQVAYHEKTLGQLFCDHKSRAILNLLLNECERYKVTILTQTHVQSILHNQGFTLKTSGGGFQAQSLVIATGGLSIPKMGASGFGYQVARQFGLKVTETAPALVPVVFSQTDQHRYRPLAGIAVECRVNCGSASFRENLLFTHQGLSGPAILQISSYWQPGDSLTIHLLPAIDWLAELRQQQSSKRLLKTVVERHLPKRLVAVFFSEEEGQSLLANSSQRQLQTWANRLQAWTVYPQATEGYGTAEVTLGGVDCHELSSKTLEARRVPGLYFIGEVVDVTGWLGGYNFQWAWSSAWAAGQVV